ncbi:ABC transporter permease [Spiroplasma endosymbiont of Crioceris asparagi]|uniref:ABC transporter permease n=1 Tax=Spiroplasma endosymbiont of Crioceris asparagi TaxID=3066286 RepID=UPI0030CAC41B
MKSYKLLLKNGFKTMFKSHKGIVFIVILTFLLSLIMNLSFTTIKKISNDFNQTVGKHEKFNSVYSKDSVLNQNKDDVFYPLMDLVDPNSYTKEYTYHDLSNEDIKDKYVKMNSFDFDYHNVDFINKTIEGNEFQLMFPFLNQVKNINRLAAGGDSIQWCNYNDLHKGLKFYLIPTEKKADKYIIDKPFDLQEKQIKDLLNSDEWYFGENRELLGYDGIFANLDIKSTNTTHQTKKLTNGIFWYSDDLKTIDNINKIDHLEAPTNKNPLEDFLFNNYKGSNSNIIDIFLDIFAKNLFTHLKNDNLDSDHSNIAEFTKLNPDWFNNLAFKNNKFINWADHFDANSNFISNNVTEKNLRMYKYIYYSIQSYVEWLANRTFDFQKYIYPDISKMKETSDYGKTGASDLSSIPEITDIKKLFWSPFAVNVPYYTFQFLFGEKINSYDNLYKEFNDSKFKDKLIIVDAESTINLKRDYEYISDKKEENQYNIDVEDKNKNISWYLGDAKGKTEEDLILNKGYRGHLNPIYFNSKDKQCYFVNNVDELQGYSNSEVSKNLHFPNKIKHYSEVFNKFNNVTDIGLYGQNFLGFNYKYANSVNPLIIQSNADVWNGVSDIALTNEYYSHTLLSSYISNVEIKKRTELFYSDASEQREFRLINLDESKQSNKITTTLLSGSMPVGDNEIGINYQFANNNNIKVGNIINIGNASYVVSGFLTDTYTFFPSSSSTMPIPSPTKGMIGYLNNSGIESLLKYTEGIEGQIQSIVNFFVYANNQKDVNKFYERLGDNLEQSQTILNNINKNDFSDSFSSVQKPSKFKDSNFGLNWSVYETVYKLMKYLLVFITIVIIVLIISIVYITVSRLIKQNAKTIAILKAQGVSSLIISFQYVWYSLPILLISIPFGTISGFFLQNFFTGLFKNYLSFNTESYQFGFLGLFLVIFILFIFIGIFIPVVIAVLIIKRPYLTLLNSEASSKKIKSFIWVKNKFFSKSSFNKKISIDLLSSEKKLLGIFFSIMIFSSFIVSLIITIPSLNLKIQNNYFKNSKYKNQYTLRDGAVNSPLAQKNINLWKGPDQLSNERIKVNQVFDGKGGNESYIYNSSDGFSSSVANSKFLPLFVYNNGTTNPLSKTIINDPGKLFNLMLGSVIYNLLNPTGKGISVGIFDQWITDCFNNASLLGDNKGVSDAEYEKIRVENASKIVSTISTMLPNVFSIATIPNLSFQPGDDWKKQLLLTFTTKAPPYIKQYIEKKDRQDITSMGLQTENLVAGKETAATTSSFNGQNLSSDVIGISKTNNSFGIDSRVKKRLFYSDKTIDEIHKLYNGFKLSSKELDDLNNQGIYNSGTNTLELPIIVNKKLQILNNLNEGHEIQKVKFNSNNLVMSTSKYNDLIIPKTAWKYDDTDFANTTYAKKTVKGLENIFKNSLNGYNQTNKRTYLDAFNIDPNKFTYKKEFDQPIDQVKTDAQTELLNNSYMFGNFSYKYNEKNGNKEIESSYLRPYYQWQNVKLFIPKSIFSNDAEQKELNRFINPRNNLYYDKDKLKEIGWTLDDNSSILVSGNEVPDDVKQGWKYKLTPEDYKELNDSNSKNWFAIRPYDIRPSIGLPGNGGEGEELKVMIPQAQYYWLREMLNDVNSGFVKFKNTESENIKNINVNFKVKGILDTYNGDTILSNIDLINTLIGASNAKEVQFNSNLLDSDQPVTNNKYNYNLYKENVFKPYVENKDDGTKLIKKYTTVNGFDSFKNATNMYNNSIYSNIEEPVGISTGVSIEKTQRDGALSVYDDFGQYDTGMKNIDMFSIKKDLFTKASMIILSISLIFIAILFIILVITLITNSDIYITKYKHFIVTLKSFGYSKRQISLYTMTIPGIIAFIGIIIGYLFMMVVSNSIIAILTHNGIVVPFAISPLIPLITFILIMSTWFSSTLIVVLKLLKKLPYESLKDTFSE